MTVLVIGRFKADPAKIEAAFSDFESDFVAISEAAKTKGGLHHRFVAGDGEVLIIDEWTSPEAFESFFGSQPKIQEIMQYVGVAGPPQFSFYQTLNSPDAF